MGKQEGKKLTKRSGLPKPLRRRGCERKRWDMGGSLSLELQPPQAPPKEGMCLAGYGMKCVGKMEGGSLKLKVHGLNSKDLRFRVQRICFVAFNLFTYQSPGSSVCGL